MATSKRLPFEKLTNTRDLGGMITADGYTIRSGLLFRSGELSAATEKDLEGLKALALKRIYDFRSAQERIEKPDPSLPGTENLHLSILEDATAGISREESSDASVGEMIVKMLSSAPDAAIRYMCATYKTFIESDHAIRQYRTFLDSVLTADGPVLWHCTAGKDRAGFGTILVETILGVDRATVREDYLYTNECLKQTIEELVKVLLPTETPDSIKDAFRDFFGAKPEYIDTLYATASECYGSLDGYIRNALGVDDTMIRRFREKYLF